MGPTHTDQGRGRGRASPAPAHSPGQPPCHLQGRLQEYVHHRLDGERDEGHPHNDCEHHSKLRAHVRQRWVGKVAGWVGGAPRSSPQIC
jgi:hypothetical protein